jgi:hypothetical protein
VYEYIQDEWLVFDSSNNLIAHEATEIAAVAAAAHVATLSDNAQFVIVKGSYIRNGGA